MFTSEQPAAQPPEPPQFCNLRMRPAQAGYGPQRIEQVVSETKRRASIPNDLGAVAPQPRMPDPQAQMHSPPPQGPLAPPPRILWPGPALIQEPSTGRSGGTLTNRPRHALLRFGSSGRPPMGLPHDAGVLKVVEASDGCGRIAFALRSQSVRIRQMIEQDHGARPWD